MVKQKRKNKKRKRERKKSVKKQKEKVSKEGSVHEPSRSTQVKRPPYLHAFKLWPYTSVEKHSAAWLHPTLPSRALAKPRYNPHPPQALRSSNLAALACIARKECSFQAFAAPRSNIQKARGILLFVSRPLLLHHASPFVPMEHATKAQGSCTLIVCVTQPCCHLSQHGPCVLLYFSSHQN